MAYALRLRIWIFCVLQISYIGDSLHLKEEGLQRLFERAWTFYGITVGTEGHCQDNYAASNGQPVMKISLIRIEYQGSTKQEIDE